MIHLLQSITPATWLFLLTLALSIIAYKYHKAIIFYYAKKNKQWAVKAVYRLKNELDERIIRDKQKRLDETIKRANELSAACNGRRMYVLQVYDDFVIVDSSKGKQWLKDNHFNSSVILSDICAFYTPATNLCENNNKESVVINWVERLYNSFLLILGRIGFKMR